MDFMIAKKHFFRHIATAELTREQLQRLRICLIFRMRNKCTNYAAKNLASPTARFRNGD